MKPMNGRVHGMVLFSLTGFIAMILAIAALFLVSTQLQRLGNLSHMNCVRDNQTRTAERELWHKQIPAGMRDRPEIVKFLRDLDHDLANHRC